jgi:hypothetical protein
VDPKFIGKRKFNLFLHQGKKKKKKKQQQQEKARQGDLHL